MTEAGWLRCEDPKRMLKFLAGKAGDRKLWLFAVAAFRRKGPSLPDRVQEAMEVTERYADGRATEAEMHVYNTVVSARQSADHAVEFGLRRLARPGRKREAQAQADLLREIVGPLPFRPVAFDPAWRTSDVMLLANGIYDEKAFDRSPILADALQDAGCDCADILGHCRGDGPHVRGCWVIDLILEKG